ADAAIDKVGTEFAGRDVVILVVTEELDRIPFAGSAGIPIEAETMEVLVDSARKSANDMAEKGAERARGLGLDPSTAIAEGGPVWAQIVDAADEREVALIALGSRGLSGIKHVLLGSVSGAVAQHSKRSVFIVHS
ncbi:MAG TPA: universal stress protein, partial [Solirubrobacterales bacterium]|nr:universal stress protein [Solirubrobacterales bacterium]